MPITLQKPLARNGGAEKYDVRQVKKALNKIKVPSPLWGEGEDEGFFIEAYPSPQPSPQRGEGAKARSNPTMKR